MDRNAKILYKKITMNAVVKQAFKEIMVTNGHFSEEVCSNKEFIIDLLFMNILD
jgi:hypothetical protein